MLFGEQGLYYSFQPSILWLTASVSEDDNLAMGLTHTGVTLMWDRDTNAGPRLELYPPYVPFVSAPHVIKSTLGCVDH
jgi:hypothetical protein